MTELELERLETLLGPGVTLGEERMHEALRLECPCCGDVGAESDHGGFFQDGQTLLCGCNGHVSLDGETPPFVNVFAGPCASTAMCGGSDA